MSNFDDFMIEEAVKKNQDIAARLDEISRIRKSNAQLLEALELLRKSVIGSIWEPLGSTGDESDWFCCQLCWAKSRDTNSLAHRKDCPMEIAKAAIRSAKGETP